jgi:hypothetical protein
MTTSEFLLLLDNIHDQFDWTLAADTGRHAERRSQPRFHIRGTTREGDASMSLDPLRAVCYVQTGTIFDYGAWSDVADALGLELSAASELVAAANDRTWGGRGSQRAPVDHLLSVRQKLLEAVGLTREAAPAE